MRGICDTLSTARCREKHRPPEYFEFMRELHNVGNNLNQVAQKAHVLNVIDVKRYDENCRRLEKLIRDVTAAVILPAKRW